jgi:hypothetical protein
VVVQDLCQLTHRDTYCSHNVLKKSARVQIQQHQAQFAVIYMHASGVQRCSYSHDWEKSAEVQEQFDGVLQAVIQHWSDAEAGNTSIEPSLYKPQQRPPPTFGLHPLGSCVGHVALKHAVYNISRLYAADWHDEQAALLHEAGEEAAQQPRTSVRAIYNKTNGQRLKSNSTILHLLPGLCTVAVIINSF